MPDPFLSLVDPIPSPPGRLRQRMRDFCIAIVVDNTPTETARREAGVAEQTIQDALQHPDVREYLVSLEQWAKRQKQYKRAEMLEDVIEEAYTLMRDAENESVKKRMIEFLTQELKSGPTNPQGDKARHSDQPQDDEAKPQSPAYSFTKPADHQSDDASEEDEQEQELNGNV